MFDILQFKGAFIKLISGQDFEQVSKGMRKVNEKIAVSIIRYAQCWEDPRTLAQALEVTADDDVLSIASGGENSLALLLKNPRSLTLVDSNPAQIFLTELKIRAIEALSYEDFVGFVGAHQCNTRKQLYAQIRRSLTEAARRYWDEEPLKIERGIIHSGKFERYFELFRRFVLPLIHGKKEIQQLLNASSLEEQEAFYSNIWNNRRWRFLFRIFFGKFLLGRLARDPSFFRYAKLDEIADELLKRTRHGFTEVRLNDNYFVEFILTGSFRNLEAAHPCLNKENFRTLKERTHRIRFYIGSLNDYLAETVNGALSKFNVSDIFEYMSEEEVLATLGELERVGRANSRLAFWTLFVPRSAPAVLRDRIEPSEDCSRNFHLNDRTFFYGDFACWRLHRTSRSNGEAILEEKRKNSWISTQ